MVNNIENLKNTRIRYRSKPNKSKTTIIPVYTGRHHYGSSTTSTNSNQSLPSFYRIFHMIIGIFALYLSFECNKEFNIGHFIAACCCPFPYIIWMYFQHKKCLVNVFK